ncbi:23S rRNA (uracil(747)-C(5))-methyltransferase RlmC [Nocardioides sp. T2.26MG-1]|uniref:23S rRNA (uracil(747)-C(5))-methyltransferase RlmC n=1 Tax=Nocardioides sp. T2.26MG-1 TaxID=3041166 RepID=UPI002477623E|nr:23S rRNA (uracil(747)-C(5))-methyltransferase RlmC [Nocardioides sp. T2.26MG-1]CAI9416058.1 23S rRNA (uracil(747)-C(5))-methyltransferase RlmC [Nocardioides sp. T2.26MG-1]
MLCSHFDAGRCRSCTWLGTPYGEQLAEKQRLVEELLAGHPGTAWLPPAASAQLGIRNKAKMVVSGTVEDPTLGILNPAGAGVDLRDCPLHTPGIQAALPELAAFVTRAALTPYDVAARRGELKYLLVTESADGELMVRFVLRSQEPVARIRKHLPALLERLPAVMVASVNLQPEHKAVLEGEREIVLTGQESLRMRVGGVALHLRPQSFFQTNTAMAAELYRLARRWVGEVAPRTVWDLYCGVGGFALGLAGPGREILGVEISREAVASAERTRDEAGLSGVRFEAGDATAYALGSGAPPDLVVVNPPRRGIGSELSGWLEASGVRHVLYSSCNAQTLVRDLESMPALRPVRGQLLDMFPNTAHYEVLVLLERA